MSLIALVLYGSCAREDHDKDSDVDIFALTTESTYRMLIQNKLNIACYPESLAIERANAGDLFILHIIKEGKVIYDRAGKLEKLKSEFRCKENYSQEITNATDLGWMLINVAKKQSNYTLINRRIAWCVRTILIANSADQKEPHFSAKDLSDYSGKSYVYNLIKNKNNDSFDKATIKSFLDFLETFGSDPNIPVNESNISVYQDYFILTNNIIGLKTIAFLKSDSAYDTYF